MRSKHYAAVVAGVKAAAYIEYGWNYATVSILVSHREGQCVTAEWVENDPRVKGVSVDEYPTYTAIRFYVKMECFICPGTAIEECEKLILSVNKHVNLEASDALVTKELLAILG